MKNNLKLLVFIFVFAFCLFFPRSEASQELPFDNPSLLISMDFQNASLKDILKIFSIQSGLNFVANEAVQDRTITLFFDKVPIKQAMEKLFRANNLSYEMEEDSNIFIVKDWGKPQVETVTRVFRLKYAMVSNSRMLDEVSDNMASEDSGTSSTDTGSSSTTSSSSSSSSSSDSSSDSSGSKDTITAAIKKLLTKDGSVIEDYRTNSLIVTDVPSKMTVVAETIAALDIPTAQILIEVEMLDVNKNLIDKLGVKFGSTPITLNTLFRGASYGSMFPFGSLIKSATQNANTVGQFAFNNGTATTDLAPPSTYQILFDFLKTQSDTKFLARPRILTLNNETAEFKITTQETINVESSTLSGSSITQQTSNVPVRAETGITLRVTPQVNTDTGEITMFIIPKVKDVTTSTLSSTSNTIKDPEERSTKSLVRVKDGETVVIGGLIRTQRSETITKLPFFGDLPLVGAAFRHRYKDKDQDRELLVFLTPHIVKDKTIELAKAQPKNKPLNMPVREQDTASLLDRQAVINRTLNGFEKK